MTNKGGRIRDRGKARGNRTVLPRFLLSGFGKVVGKLKDSGQRERFERSGLGLGYGIGSFGRLDERDRDQDEDIKIKSDTRQIVALDVELRKIKNSVWTT